MKVITLQFINDPETDNVILGYIEDHEDMDKVVRKCEEEIGANLVKSEESVDDFMIFSDGKDRVIVIEKVEKFEV